MGMPVKLSDQLVLDARTAAEVTDRSITGQIEFWASLGKALEQAAGFHEIAALKRAGKCPPLSTLIDQVGRPEGAERLRAVLAARPFPQFEPTATPSVFARIDADGTRTLGRFVQRQFVPMPAAAPAIPQLRNRKRSSSIKQSVETTIRELRRSSAKAVPARSAAHAAASR